MMKKFFLVIFLPFFLFPLTNTAQERMVVTGTIQMPQGDDPAGISIFNINSNRGTVSNNIGEFNIAVALDDSIRVNSIQFQEFTVIINQGIIDNGQMNIVVKEVVNQLPEVVVNPSDLTGNIRVDITRLEVVEVPDTLNARDVQNTYVAADSLRFLQTTPQNIAFEEDENRLVNGLNFVNLFKELLISNKKDRVQRPEAEIDNDVRALFNDSFFKENLDIPIDKITEFIYFADDNGLNEEMLREGNELDLLEFLVIQSKKFKKNLTRE